jgi:cysteine-rich repeat protein
MPRTAILALLAFSAACGSRTDMPDAVRATTALPDSERCGNAVVETGEECDDGNARDDDACTNACKTARCGDGVLYAQAELCDDGNERDGDGCTRFCGPETCGDGIVQGKELCDDGNVDPRDGCLPSCLPPFCGDGVISATEECDEGGANRDQPAFLLSQPNEPERAVFPVVTRQVVRDYYAYSSASGHTGLERPEESRAWLHAGAPTGALSLIVSHGVDENGSRNQPDGRVEMDILGVPTGVVVALADDKPAEFSAAGPGSVRGRWTFSRNTDGGVITGLPFPGSWTITIDARFLQGIGSWSWIDGNIARDPLALGKRATLRAFDRPSTCRSTCKRPRCGDGILDGGEVCDGQTFCSPTCKSFL